MQLVCAVPIARNGEHAAGAGQAPVGRGRRLLGVLLILVPLLLVGWDAASEFLAADRCLDSGGVYDDRERRCRRDVVHLPQVSYWQRRPERIALGGLSMLIGGWMLRRGSGG